MRYPYEECSTGKGGSPRGTVSKPMGHVSYHFPELPWSDLKKNANHIVGVYYEWYDMEGNLITKADGKKTKRQLCDDIEFFFTVKQRLKKLEAV
jgi:hypothetical protein